MKCEMAQQSVILAMYGELPDELAGALERHLDGCESCRTEVSEMRSLAELLKMDPVIEPSPNLLAQSRVRLDEALDQIPPHSFLMRLRGNVYRWFSYAQAAPALMTLLVGVGFLAGNFTYRYEVAHEQKPAPAQEPWHNPLESTVANVTGIVQTPDPQVVQVKYNRLVPETIQGSVDDEQIRHLLLLGMTQASNADVHENSVRLLSNECKLGHACRAGSNEGDQVRGALLVSLRYDRDAGVRLKALEGLQPYVAQDQHVRDAVLESLMHDKSADVRTAAIDLLTPVQSDSSVQEVLRTVSTQDDNPYIRTASYRAIQDAAGIQ